jgi:hypothetical protein
MSPVVFSAMAEILVIPVFLVPGGVVERRGAGTQGGVR